MKYLVKGSSLIYRLPLFITDCLPHRWQERSFDIPVMSSALFHKIELRILSNKGPEAGLQLGHLHFYHFPTASANTPALPSPFKEYSIKTIYYQPKDVEPKYKLQLNTYGTFSSTPFPPSLTNYLCQVQRVILVSCRQLE
jgi:hypothetical protein